MPDEVTVVTETQAFQDAVASAVAAAVEKETLGLRTNRDAILGEKKEIQKKLEAYTDIDPAKHKALLEADAKRQEEKAKAEGNWEKLQQQLIDQHTEEVAKRDERNKTLLTALEEQLVTRAALESLTKQKAAAGLLLPHVLKQLRMVEEDGEFSTVVVDVAGAKRLAKDAKDTSDMMTIDQLVESMKEQDEFAPAFGKTMDGGNNTQSTAQGSDQTTRASGNAPKVIKGNDPNFNDLFVQYAAEIKKGEVVVDYEELM